MLAKFFIIASGEDAGTGGSAVTGMTAFCDGITGGRA
jgi:hypothetical protein